MGVAVMLAGNMGQGAKNVLEALRIVRIGDYDACACIGAHVTNTREVGTFRIISHSFADGIWRLRWKVIQ